MTTMRTSALLTLSLMAFAATVIGAQQPVSDGPKYTAAGELIRPADYREWIYLTTGLGMTYGPAQPPLSNSLPGGRPAAGRPANFDNVFVNSESHRQFMTTGKWPDKTIFILEIRSAETNVSINNGGQTQGAIVAIEAAVKDQARFPQTTWAYFDLGAPPAARASAAALPPTARCYSCHRENTAVEQTFVQFYPTLFDVAKRMGTVKPTYDPNHKAQ